MRDSSFNHPSIRLEIFIARLFVFTLLSSLFAVTSLAQKSSFALSNSKVGTLARELTAQETKQAEVRELKLGVPIERELAGGGAHSYSVMLTAEQYLKVVVEQKGIDVVIRLSGPDGKNITEVDSPNGMRGPEMVLLIAPASANYLLQVVSLEKAAALGRYEIKVVESRQSTTKDQDRIAAEKFLAEAEQLRVEGTAASSRKAIENYKQALPLLLAAGDREAEARATNRTGVIYWKLGEIQNAFDHFSRAIELWRALGNRKEEATLLHNFGTVYWQLGDNQKALEYYNRALPLRRSEGDGEGTAITLDAMGLAYAHLGKLQEALDYHNQSLALVRTLPGRPNEANVLTDIGGAYLRMGNLQKALEHQFQALPLWRAARDRRGEASTLNNIGSTYLQLGEREKALEYHNQALLLRRATGDRIGEVSTLSNIGLDYWLAGDLPKALEYYNEALSLVRAVRDRWGEGNVLDSIGQVKGSMGDLPKALEYFNQSLLLRREVGDRRGEATTLSHIGGSYISLGKPLEAVSYLERSLSLYRVVGDKVNEGSTLKTLARAERDRGRLEEAQTYMDAALRIVESTRSQLVNQQLRTSYSASRHDYYEFYINLLMRMHTAQPSAGYDALALQSSERARARSLLDMLTEASADIRQGVEPVLVERERSLQRQLSAKSERLIRLLNGKHTEEQETAARKEAEALLDEYQDVEAQIRAKSPRYAALTQPQPLSMKEIQQLLDDDTLLLEYALGEERSYMWAVTPTSVATFELPKRVDIETTARNVYELVTARNKNLKFEERTERERRVAKADAEYFQAASALSLMILGPVANQMKGKRLLIVSDGVLQYIPFAALPLPQRLGVKNQSPLITEHEIISLPSASSLALLRRELRGRQTAAKVIAVVADPVFQADDPRVKGTKPTDPPEQPAKESSKQDALDGEMQRSASDVGGVEFRRLPYTRQEADGIAAFVSRELSRELLDFDANREKVAGADLSNYRIVHFATHGFLNSQHPELSGIVLSLVDESGRPQDGFLRLHEIYNLKLGADLVVLSACKTALGKEIKGEGLVGLTRGFMYAGAPRVVASLWAVNDEITAELMKRFYREMLVRKQRPAAALRAAQVSIWRERQLPPYYWAAFVLQGEWK